LYSFKGYGKYFYFNNIFWREKPDYWFWSDHTLRKTTLDKGQMVRGKVVFPRDNELKEFEVLVPVEELMFTFAFQQRLFQP